jgi:2'-5' RNA ligase
MDATRMGATPESRAAGDAAGDAAAMRLFVALNLPDDLRQAVHAATAPLRDAAPREVGWVRADALHLTLKFLGDVEPARTGAIVDALREVAARHLATRVTLAGIGAFPALARPRVVWVGVEATPRLELLQHDVEATCAALGFEVEGRPFRPHVTLGRVRPGAAAAMPPALATAAATCTVAADVLVDTLDLMHSTLMPGGTRHVAVARLPFREE